MFENDFRGRRKFGKEMDQRLNGKMMFRDGTSFSELLRRFRHPLWDIIFRQGSMFNMCASGHTELEKMLRMTPVSISCDDR